MRSPVIEYRISEGDHSTRRSRGLVVEEERDAGLDMHEDNSENRSGTGGRDAD